jgi:sulfite reductase (NADPH) flavoprotein alpha-component
LQQFYQSADQKAVSTQIISNDLLCPPDYNRDFRKITVQKRNGALDYGLGDALDIFPTNDVEKVHTFLQEYSPDFDERTVVKLHAWGIDGDISLGVLFTNILDLFGKPSMHFLQQLATFETDEEERSIMLDLQFLKAQAKKAGITHADVLMRFKKAHPPLPALLAMIPLIKPRAYSIASAPVASPDTIELCVLINTWWTKQDENDGMRYGLTCDMLRKLTSGDRLWCRIKPGSMEAPSPDQPVVCAGIGSGLAPHLAFLRDRVYRYKTGEVPSPAPFSLYFGNRFYAKEFLYQNEMEEYVEAYGKSWFTLHTAFSRDDPSGKKVYVQDLVGSTEDARKLLHEDTNGMLYVCGNQNLPKPLQQALVRSFSQKSTDPNEIAAATAAMEDMFVHGRAQQEVW